MFHKAPIIKTGQRTDTHISGKEMKIPKQTLAFLILRKFDAEKILSSKNGAEQLETHGHKNELTPIYSIHKCSFYFCFLGSRPQHMEVPRRGAESELQLPARTTAAATWEASHVCDLHPSSRQHRILNPRSKARNRTHILMDPSRICFHCATTGTNVNFRPQT